MTNNFFHYVEFKFSLLSKFQIYILNEILNIYLQVCLKQNEHLTCFS